MILRAQFSKKYTIIFKIVHNFLVFFEKKYRKRLGLTIVSYGFDNAEKPATDVHTRTSEKYAHSTLRDGL